MEEKKKKKKLTLSISSNKPHNVSNYGQSSGKTSVVIEKKPQRRWGEKKFQPRSNNFNKPKPTSGFLPKKPPFDRNIDIRKKAEERATKRFKDKGTKGESLQPKKTGLAKEKGLASRREYKLTLSKATDEAALDGKERSLAAVKRARLKEKKNQDSSKKIPETKTVPTHLDSINTSEPTQASLIS